MSLDRQYGRLFMCCEECGETFEQEKGQSFADFIEEAKEQGWVIVKDENDDYRHYCGSPCNPPESL